MGLGGVGAGGYLGEKAGYGGTVYPAQYGCYYTNMDYLSPAGMAAHSSVVPVSVQHSTPEWQVTARQTACCSRLLSLLSQIR